MRMWVNNHNNIQNPFFWLLSWRQICKIPKIAYIQSKLALGDPQQTDTV